jgi:hypothetical protein
VNQLTSSHPIRNKTVHPMTVENTLRTVADEPKPLDFRPIEAHDFRYMTSTHQDDVYSARKRFSPEPSTRLGFASTVVYFERLAQKEARDPDRRQRLLEVAGFYRSLARIIPGIPTGYKSNGAALPVTRAERWKARAEECRTLADCFTDPICRGQLTRLAQGYDQMAVAAE